MGYDKRERLGNIQKQYEFIKKMMQEAIARKTHPAA